jgi:hypothetical protein
MPIEDTLVVTELEWHDKESVTGRDSLNFNPAGLEVHGSARDRCQRASVYRSPIWSDYHGLLGEIMSAISHPSNRLVK